MNDARGASFNHPGRAWRDPEFRAGTTSWPMCDECEEIEPLTVAYYGKMERKGWRPPASANTDPILDDRLVTGRPYAIAAPRFVCEPQGAHEVD